MSQFLSICYWLSIFIVFLICFFSAGVRKYQLISELTAGKIIQLHKSGLSSRKIEAELRRTKSIGDHVPPDRSIRNFLEKYQRTGSVKRLAGQGRPRKTDPRDDRQITRIAKTKRKSSLGSVASDFRNLSGISIGRNTVRRRLKEIGYRVFRCAKKPLISPDNWHGAVGQRSQKSGITQGWAFNFGQ